MKYMISSVLNIKANEDKTWVVPRADLLTCGHTANQSWSHFHPLEKVRVKVTPNKSITSPSFDNLIFGAMTLSANLPESNEL